MIERLRILQDGKSRYTSQSVLAAALKTDTHLKHEVEILTQTFLHRKVSGCTNCYIDAYLELIHFNIQKAMEKLECNFALKAGALLMDNDDISNNMTNANISNDLALYHLKKNPKCRRLFTKLPYNIDELLEDKQSDTVLEYIDELLEDKQSDTVLEYIDELAKRLQSGETTEQILGEWKNGSKLDGKNLSKKWLTELLEQAAVKQ